MKTLRRPLRPSPPPRRGIAMLLVLVAMGTATTLTLGWLATHDNATPLSRNVSRTLQARAAASSGLELAIAIMQTPTEWRTSHAGGLLLDDYPLAEGRVDVFLTDVATGLPPAAGADTIRVRVTATMDNVVQEIEAIASVSSLLPPDSEDLSGFSIWVNSELQMQGQSSLERWHSAPMAHLGRRLFIGTAARDTQRVSFGSKVLLSDVTLISGEDASPRLIENDSDMYVPSRISLVSFAPKPAPNHLPPPTGSRSASTVFNPRHDDWSDHPAHLSLDSGGTLALPPASRMSLESLDLDHGTTVVITGDTTLSVHGDVRLTDSSIVLADGASLSLTVGGRLDLENAYLGDEGGHLLDAEGVPSWSDASRIHIAATASSGTAPSWRVAGDSIIKAELEAPTRRVVLRDRTVLAGRISADSLRLRHGASVLYDHGLDSGRGLSRSAMLEDTDGRSQIRRRLARRLQQILSSFGGRRARPSAPDANPGSARHASPAPVAAFGITPDQAWYDTPSQREVPVEVRLLQRGGDTRSWESLAAGVRRGKGS